MLMHTEITYLLTLLVTNPCLKVYLGLYVLVQKQQYQPDSDYNSESLHINPVDNS